MQSGFFAKKTGPLAKSAQACYIMQIVIIMEP